MSLGAELLFRQIADDLAPEPVCFLSVHGDGSPLLNASACFTQRMARWPVGGVQKRDGFSTFAPPLDIVRQQEDASRIMAARRLFIDALDSDVEDLLAQAEGLSPGSTCALRRRSLASQSEPTIGALRSVFTCPESGDQIFLRRDLITDDLMNSAAAYEKARIDEYDAFSSAFRGGIELQALRYGAGAAEVVFAPASLLDQPDAHQIAMVLGEDRVVMSSDGGCALFVPQMSSIPSEIGVVLKGLDPDDADPSLSLMNADGWHVETQRKDAVWRARAIPLPDSKPVMSVFIEIEAESSPEVEIVEVSSWVCRSRSAWEIWDEAQSQLELEESW